MDRNIRVSIHDGVVRVALRGEVVQSGGAKVMSLAGAAAAQAGSRLVLFDITRARSRSYHALAVDHVRHARESGAIKYRIAILGRPGDEKLSYFENVAINRGIRARSFTAEGDALAWLKRERGDTV
jgi:hypothetical protein